MAESTERLAIISEVGIGYRDIDSPVLWFSESSAALQVLSWDEAYEVLKGVREVRDLNGLACWVSCEGNRIKFLRMWSR